LHDGYLSTTLIIIWFFVDDSASKMAAVAAIAKPAATATPPPAPTPPIGEIVLVNPTILDHLPDLVCVICTEVLRGNS
jgi:hypothetical protein